MRLRCILAWHKMGLVRNLQTMDVKSGQPRLKEEINQEATGCQQAHHSYRSHCTENTLAGGDLGILELCTRAAECGRVCMPPRPHPNSIVVAWTRPINRGSELIEITQWVRKELCSSVSASLLAVVTHGQTDRRTDGQTCARTHAHPRARAPA